VVHVGQHLIVGESVNGGHLPVHHANGGLQRRHQRRKAVGGARRVADNAVAGHEGVVVHAIDDGLHVVAGRLADDHLLGAALDVQAGLFGRGEETGALHDHVNPEFAPGQLGRVAVGQHANLVAVDDHVIAFHFHGAGEAAMRGVVARQVGVGVNRTQVVDRDDLHVFATAFIERTQHIAPDSSVPVDPDLDRHRLPSFLSK